MSIVSLQEAKLHLRVTDSTEDSLIQRCIEAAEAHIAHYLNRPIPGAADSPPAIPKDIIAAALMIVGDLYENRQTQVISSSSPVGIVKNDAAWNLIYPYRVNIGI